jgi:hypothetical protein
MAFDPTDEIDRAKRNLRDALVNPYQVNQIVDQIEKLIDAKIARAIRQHTKAEPHTTGSGPW